MKDPLIYIHHILECIDEIEKYSSDLTQNGFIESSEKQSAVIWKLTVIGEAAGQIPEEIRVKYPQIPWSKIRAARNILIHEYFKVDAIEVWKIVSDDLPELKLNLEKILADLPG